jgi:soluble lytic murein transglycosylase-like protein
VLGLIQVESGFRKYAISIAGARGYMQVMPFWTRLIGDGDRVALFHMQTNLRFGCVILRHYLDRKRATCSWRWAATTAAGGARISERGAGRGASGCCRARCERAGFALWLAAATGQASPFPTF